MISVFIATLTLDGPVKLAEMRGDGHPKPNRNSSLCPKPTFDNNWLLNVLIRFAPRQSFELGAAKMHIRVLEKSLPPWGCILLAECKACSIWSVNSFKIQNFDQTLPTAVAVDFFYTFCLYRRSTKERGGPFQTVGSHWRRGCGLPQAPWWEEEENNSCPWPNGCC